MNTGFRDALVLVNNLTNTGPECRFASVNEAIADYAVRMYQYAQEAQEMTEAIQNAMRFD